MGRTKTFDERQVLQQAMLVFWEHGYQATTYATLELVTGLSGRSLINAFGDKDAIFEKALAHYYQSISRKLDDLNRTPGVAAIRQFFGEFTEVAPDDPRNFGCLMLNSIYEQDKLAVPAKQLIEGFRELFVAFFQQALHAEGIGNSESKAHLLVACLWGLGSHIRLMGEVHAIALIIPEVDGLLSQWMAGSKIPM